MLRLCKKITSFWQQAEIWCAPISRRVHFCRVHKIARFTLGSALFKLKVAFDGSIGLWPLWNKTTRNTLSLLI
jgi:hypothetical protein